jgi:hypothetical protein
MYLQLHQPAKDRTVFIKNIRKMSGQLRLLDDCKEQAACGWLRMGMGEPCY